MAPRTRSGQKPGTARRQKPVIGVVMEALKRNRLASKQGIHEAINAHNEASVEHGWTKTNMKDRISRVLEDNITIGEYFFATEAAYQALFGQAMEQAVAELEKEFPGAATKERLLCPEEQRKLMNLE
jgi:hypothetical protein